MKNIEKLYDDIFKLKSNMEGILDDATNITTQAREFSGEISRVLVEQFNKYYIPKIRALIDDEKTPGSIVGIVRFLDSVPLAMTREAPTPEPVQPVVPENPALVTPEGTTAVSEVEALPQNISYAKPQGETPVQEKKEVEKLSKALKPLKESYKRYQVVRSLDVSSSLGDTSKKDKVNVIAEFNTKEEAEERAKMLDKTVTLGERESFGTKYIVVEKEFGKKN